MKKSLHHLLQRQKKINIFNTLLRIAYSFFGYLAGKEAA